MTNPAPYAITISRQLGSGGAYLGRKLATGLRVSYADREILERAADSLRTKASDIESREEAVPSFLDTVLEALVLGVPEVNYASALEMPSYSELQLAEANVIREIAARRSAVIVGRAGCFLLSQHPRHLSVFVHAELGFRLERIESLFGVSREKAMQLIENSDNARGRYLQELTGRTWTDAEQYHVSLCTSSVGLESASELLLALVRRAFELS